MPPFSFIHAADLHIGAPFRGLSVEDAGQAPARLLRDSTLRAFHNLVDLALREQVDFVLLAGDVFDGAEVGLRARLEFRDGLVRLDAAGIATFVVRGNHDPPGSRAETLRWPQRVYFFGPEPRTLVAIEDAGRPQVVVAGASFATREEKRPLATLLPRNEGSAFHIGLLHCNLGGASAHANYAPCTLADLRGKGLDYWALGHVHERAIVCREPWVVYPGNTQGLSIREPGERGCMLVRVDEQRRAQPSFVPLDVARWSTLEVDARGLQTVDALERRMLRLVEEELAAADGRHLLCRIRLVGRGPLYRALRREQGAGDLLARLRERLTGREPLAWVQRLELDLQPELDLRQRAAAGDLVAEVLLAARELRGQPGGLQRLRREVLGELWDKRWERSAVRALPLEPPDDAELEAILHEAELICLDTLEDWA